MKLFVHFSRVSEEPMTKRVNWWHMKGKRAVNKPCAIELGGVKNACTLKSLELRKAMLKCIYREQWRDFEISNKDCTKI